jgi:hypothetical protein
VFYETVLAEYQAEGGTAFLIGAALSPWLRSTVVAALLALVSTWLVLIGFVFASLPLRIGSLSGAWAGTGTLLVVLAPVTLWSTMRSRAFEPLAGKDLRVLLVVFAVWLAIVGIVYGPTRHLW